MIFEQELQITRGKIMSNLKTLKDLEIGIHYGESDSLQYQEKYEELKRELGL